MSRSPVIVDAVLRRARTAIVIAIVAGSCVSVPAVATAQTNQSASGSGTATWEPGCFSTSPATVAFDFSATSGPNGENASGSFWFVCQDGPNGLVSTQSGTISCLNVNGNTATLGGTITHSSVELFQFERLINFTVTDTPDATSRIGRGAAVCTSFREANHPIDRGEIIVQDAAPAPAECSDGIDNDGDGRIDHHADRQCESPDDPSERSQCSDELDNDQDGRIDYPSDPGCQSARDNSEGPNPQCSDGVDNDGDGATDYPDDPGCQGVRDNTEGPNPHCSDGVDNDGDGAVDHPADPDCRSIRDSSEGSNSPPA
jgi:hypothetical protein